MGMFTERDDFEIKPFVELMELVKKIPHYCGNPACFAPGCLAIRDARDKIREIENGSDSQRIRNVRSELRGETSER